MTKSNMEKEELLTMLTEIYEQLGELEQAIETHLTYRRKSYIQAQSERLLQCEEKINKLEGVISDRRLISLRNSEKTYHKNLKLELGF